ncbi:PTS glucose transporter subunit IIA [Catenovulum sp. SX2]|uniref:PTS glucose transporter subunit IIA n=1 Tax=Catenovulum sp. SX2 TaxID=3398614 RepID=UPI003F851819
MALSEQTAILTQQALWRIAAPCNGHVNNISNHPSNLISHQLAGEGVCIEIYGEQLVSPVDGVIVFIEPLLIMLRIKTAKGLIVEIRLPDIVKDMMRNGFKLMATEQQQVITGQVLLTFHRQKLLSLQNKLHSNKKLHLSMTLPNLPSQYVVQCHFNKVTAAQDFCIEVYPPADRSQEQTC